MSLSLTSNETLFGTVLDDLVAYRAGTAPAAETCAACGREFPTLEEVFSHPCPPASVPRGPIAVDPAPVHRHGGNGQRTPMVSEPIDPAKVEAWLVGLGRKVVDSDVTPRVGRAAREWIIRQEIVDGDFMADMQRRAEKGWTLSTGQVRGIMNVWRSKLLKGDHAEQAETPAAAQARTNKFEGRCPNCRKTVEAGAGTLEKIDGRWVVYHREGECPVSEFAATDGTKVPEGRYAYETDEGIKFFQLVDGRVFVQASDELHPVAGGGQGIIDRIATDIEGAARLYGREIGACCRCGRTLTSEWRQQGIGPKCAQKAGW